MQLTILLFLACHVFGQDDGDAYSGGESDVEDQGPHQPPVSLLSHHQELSDDGTFKYSFSADNGLQQKEAFHPDGSRTGAYSYVDPQGETVLVHYRADRFGFHILDGSSIPTTPPHAGRSQEGAPNDDDGAQGPRDTYAPETSAYEVEEHDGESSAPADVRPQLSPPAAPRPFGFEFSRAPKQPGLHNRFHRSASRELFLEDLVPNQSDIDSVAAEDLSGAATSYNSFGLPGYIPVEQRKSPYKSPYASLARQIQYPVKKGIAEAQVEDSNSNDSGREPAAVTDGGILNDSGREQAVAADNGDYSLHVGRYDDGSYSHHAAKYDDGSYPQHAIKYDDGSYDKYARAYVGQSNEPSGHSGDEDVGRAEYEAGYVRQPGEAEVSHY